MENRTLQVNIIRARRDNPCATLAEIGTRYSITRERVRQVLSKAGKPTRAYHQTYLCIRCGKDIGRVEGLFCSQQCRHDYGHIKIACTYCGKLREYSVKDLIWRIKHGQHSHNLFFCSKHCQGKWFAEIHGFIAHPENTGVNIRKWDYNKVYELRKQTSWGALRIGRALGIPTSTVAAILQRGITPVPIPAGDKDHA